MKKGTTILFALSCLVIFWAGAGTHSIRITRAYAGSIPVAGNIPDGMYTIVGEASRRCLEVPNSSCAAGFGLQTFECDRTGVSNNQKFNVVSDGTGNYSIIAVNSDLCLEVYADEINKMGRIPIKQAVCSAEKVSQKWAMSQYGDNLQIRSVQNNQCIDVMRNSKDNYAPIFLRPCVDGTNQRWRLSKTTLNTDKGVICKASPSHPEYGCSGVNDKQQQVHLGKTLTKARCEEACQATKMVSCRWEGSK
jgi:hypothetical protein